MNERKEKYRHKLLILSQDVLKQNILYSISIYTLLDDEIMLFSSLFSIEKVQCTQVYVICYDHKQFSHTQSMYKITLYNINPNAIRIQQST